MGNTWGVWQTSRGYGGQQVSVIDITTAQAVSPETIFGANLVAWYKADTDVFSDAGTTPATDGQTVQQWNDQSGNGYHLSQATASIRPTFNTGSFNGQPALTFDANDPGDALLSVTDVVALNTTTVSAFLVVRGTDTSNSFRRMFGIISPGANNSALTPNFTQIWNNSGAATATWELFAGGARQGNGGNAVSDTAPSAKRYGAIFDGANANMYLDNVVQGAATAFSATLGNASGNTLYAGAGDVQTLGTGCLITEYVLVNRAATSDERDDLDSYFVSKWGF